MALFEYRGDASVFTVSGSNDAPLPNTKINPLTSGTTNNRSFAIPLVIGCLLVSGRGASLLPDTIKTEVSAWYSNIAIKLYICFLGSLHVSSNIFPAALVDAPHVSDPTTETNFWTATVWKRYGWLWSQILASSHWRTHFSLDGLNKQFEMWTNFRVT
jgi:hypothetical protein